MTIADPQSFNRYTYVNNDPVNLVDPTGLMLSDIGVVQTQDEQYARTLQGAGDADFQRSINEDYSDRHNYILMEACRGKTPYFMTEGTQQGLTPKEQQQLQEQEGYFPGFSTPDDQAAVSQAMNDAWTAVATPLEGGSGAFSLILIAAFRPQGNTTTPERAIDALDATSGIRVVRNADVSFGLEIRQNVHDGRRSSLGVPDDNSNTVTVTQYFNSHPTVSAITFDGHIFLGQGFFNKDRGGRAKDIIHEGVVHKGFGRSDLDFGTPRPVGSRAINSIIDRYYPQR